MIASDARSDRPPAKMATATSRPSQSPGLGFVLFIVLNAVLFLRPMDIIPALAGWPIYLAVISSCLAIASTAVVRQLTPRSLAQDPISACVLGVLGSVVLSHLCHGAIGEAARCGWYFLKVVLYYFLLVAIVDSPRRYCRFLGWISIFVIIVTALPLLQYHGYVDIPAIEPLHERQDEIDPATGAPIVLERLKSTGIYDNPNDLSRIVVVGIILGLYWLNDRALGMRRAFWLAPVGLLGYALHLTQSRGGCCRSWRGCSGCFIRASAGPRPSSSPLSSCLPCSSPSRAGRPKSTPARVPDRRASNSGMKASSFSKGRRCSGSGWISTRKSSAWSHTTRSSSASSGEITPTTGPAAPINGSLSQPGWLVHVSGYSGLQRVRTDDLLSIVVGYWRR